jgi:hypothetical protein
MGLHDPGMFPESLPASEVHSRVCSFCQQQECVNAAHAVTVAPARDGRGWRIAPGWCSVWRRLIAEYCIDLSDAYTLEKINEIYYRSGGLNLGSGTDALWTHKRAAGGELHTVIRYAREIPQDERHNTLICFVPESRVRGSRTPDFLVLSEHAIERKLFHGQISQQTQGVIVFRLPFATLDGSSFQTWQTLLNSIRRRRRTFPAGQRRIEVTTGARDATTNTRRMHRSHEASVQLMLLC